MRFDPRPVRVPSPRPAGRDWLNGPLVWAIETAWRGLYLFPRDCPRILLRRTANTNVEDSTRWFGESPADLIAYVETRWVTEIERRSFIGTTFLSSTSKTSPMLACGSVGRLWSQLALSGFQIFRFNSPAPRLSFDP